MLLSTEIIIYFQRRLNMFKQRMLFQPERTNLTVKGHCQRRLIFWLQVKGCMLAELKRNPACMLLSLIIILQMAITQGMPPNQYHPCRETSKCIHDAERAELLFFPGVQPLKQQGAHSLPSYLLGCVDLVFTFDFPSHATPPCDIPNSLILIL